MIWLVTDGNGERALIRAALKTSAKVMARQMGAEGVLGARLALEEEMDDAPIIDAEFNATLGDPGLLDLRGKTPWGEPRGREATGTV